ncbi:MAG: hypothetical protein IIC39_00225 [Candidatus Marinimicrobia bacterium]|nr:hypothetical protein [Candidatus Neomarinimicrobiota bacterium]
MTGQIQEVTKDSFGEYLRHKPNPQDGTILSELRESGQLKNRAPVVRI